MRQLPQVDERKTMRRGRVIGGQQFGHYPRNVTFKMAATTKGADFGVLWLTIYCRRRMQTVVWSQNAKLWHSKKGILVAQGGGRGRLCVGQTKVGREFKWRFHPLGRWTSVRWNSVHYRRSRVTKTSLSNLHTMWAGTVEAEFSGGPGARDGQWRADW